MKLNISLGELIFAYRSVKMDCWFEKTPFTKLLFAEFEKKLIPNLNYLLEKINTVDFEYFSSKSFLGDYYYTIKNIELSPVKEGENIFHTSLKNQLLDKNVDIKFRVMSKHSVEFHILSALWISKIGTQIDKRLSDNSYGCRLQVSIIENEQSQLNTVFGDLQTKPVNQFKNYLPNYKKWQQSGLKEIAEHLKKNKKVCAVTLDITKYYHRISPKFINDTKFLKEIGIDKWSQNEKELNILLLFCLDKWSELVNQESEILDEFLHLDSIGIPIHLGASKVIANALLCSLDKKIEEELNPIYYGRYVDDFFIVLNDNGKIKNSDDFWKLIQKCIPEIESETEFVGVDKLAINDFKTSKIYKCSFSEFSLIEFGKGKEKFFFLEGIEALTFVKNIEDAINANSSEWKLPPDLDEDSENYNDDILSTSSSSKGNAISLSKVEEMSLQRQKFILYLKRFIKLTELFPENYWKKNIEEYLQTTMNFVLRPESISIYQKYFSELFGLAIITNNFKLANEFYYKINSLKELYNFEKIKEKSKNKGLAFKNAIVNLLLELRESVPFYISPFDTLKYINEMKFLSNDINESSVKLNRSTRILFEYDLHNLPLKSFFIKKQRRPLWIKSKKNIIHIDFLTDIRVPKQLQAFEIFNKLTTEDDKAYILPNFFFYTRRFSLAELSYIIRDWHSHKEEFKEVVKFFNINCNLPKCEDEKKD